MKLYLLRAITLVAGYLVIGCANGGSTATSSSPSTGATGDVSGPGGTGTAGHGITTPGVGHTGGR